MLSPEKSDGKPLAFVLSNSKTEAIAGKLASGTMIFKSKEEIADKVKQGVISEKEGKSLIEMNNLSKNPVVFIVSKGDGKCIEQQGLK